MANLVIANLTKAEVDASLVASEARIMAKLTPLIAALVSDAELATALAALKAGIQESPKVLAAIAALDAKSVSGSELAEAITDLKAAMGGIEAGISNAELAEALAALETKLVSDPELKLAVDELKAAIAAVSTGEPLPPVEPPAPPLTRPVPDEKVLRIGKDQFYKNLKDGFLMKEDGDTLELYGVFTDELGASSAVGDTKTLRIIGKTPGCELKWTKGSAVRMTLGKGHLVLNGFSNYIEGIKFTGMSVIDNNGAGIRFGATGSQVIVNCEFYDGQEGILSTAPNVILRNSRFARLGIPVGQAGSGQTHACYFTHGTMDLLIEDCVFGEVHAGHQIKSRSAKTVVRRCQIADFGSSASYSIDITQGGDVLIENCVIEQGANAQINRGIFTYAYENGPIHPINDYKMRNCIVIDDKNFGQLFKIHAEVTMAMMSGIENNIFIGELPTTLVCKDGTINLALKNKFFKTRAAAGLAAYPFLPALPA